MRLLLLIMVAIVFNHSDMDDNTTLHIDTTEVKHQMRGGMGASWHAISKELPLNNHLYKYPVREYAPRGSAYGGNPPITNTAAWEQVLNHASWLGLNFIRVELSQRMYEPRRQQFDWDNEEMKALYKILDWCQENGADVLLQQMWHYTDWNSIPGVHPLISAPKNLDDFASGIATLLEHLYYIKGYTCIKYFGMTNEPPGGTWGYWWEYGDSKGTIDDAWKRLQKELDERKIKPENEAYYGFGIISRFLSKYSSILKHTHNKPDSILMTAALMSPDNHLSVFMINNSNNLLSIKLKIDPKFNRELYCYQVSKNILAQADFKLEPLKLKSKQLVLPPNSISTVSTYKLRHTDNGIIVN
jgi:hypothetical protein